MSDFSYWESCPECDSLNLMLTFLPKEDEDEDIVFFSVTCKDCGETWNDWEKVDF